MSKSSCSPKVLQALADPDVHVRVGAVGEAFKSYNEDLAEYAVREGSPECEATGYAIGAFEKLTERLGDGPLHVTSGSLWPYLCTIVRHALQKRSRDDQKLGSVVPISAEVDPPGADKNAEQILTGDLPDYARPLPKHLQVLLEALLTLPHETQQVLKGRAQAGMKYAILAKELGVSEGAARVRYKRAKDALKAAVLSMVGMLDEKTRAAVLAKLRVIDDGVGS